MVAVIHSEELGIPGETGVYDLSTPHDLARHTWLASLMLRLAAARRPSQCLWSVDQATVSRAFLLAARQSGVASLW